MGGRDRYHAVFERLAERVDDVAVEFREFIGSGGFAKKPALRKLVVLEHSHELFEILLRDVVSFSGLRTRPNRLQKMLVVSEVS